MKILTNHLKLSCNRPNLNFANFILQGEKTSRMFCFVKVQVLLFLGVIYHVDTRAG